MSLLFLFIAIVAGAFNPAQSGTNAELNKHLGHSLPSTIFVYASGLIGLLLFQAVFRQSFPGHARIVSVPWWAWLGGLISLLPTMAGLTLAQKMGSGVFTGVTVTSAIVVSILLDNYSLMGFKQHPASITRIAGAALMIVSLWLVAKF
jgi:transporter family-2 protein